MPLNLTSHFQRFLQSDPQRLHFAAHSHHPWPDVTFEAHQQAWLDAARLMDDKWDHVFGVVWPEAQRHVADELRLPDPSTVVFAPNTHEFVLRLISCLKRPKPRIVSSDSEFHSFERQTRRLEEAGLATVVRVPSQPFDTFGARLRQAVEAEPTDLVFFSHVFFNSGAVVPDVQALVRSLPGAPLVVVDGYHGFLAVPTDWSSVADRAFYLAGGYKYAMAGEGACFLHVPASAPMRPVNTGWFAAFGALGGEKTATVPYASTGARFMGATFDPSGLYRFNAVMRWRAQLGLTTLATRVHAHALQRQLTDGLRSKLIEVDQLVVSITNSDRGQFLTFKSARAHEICAALKAVNVVTDVREDRLRFGFGVAHTSDQVSALLSRVAALT